MIAVMDASAAIEIVINGRNSGGLLAWIRKADTVLAPDLYVPEITNAFWKLSRQPGFGETRCLESIETALQLVDHFESTLSLYREAFDLSYRFHHSVYDMLYVSLARRNAAHLLTLDRKLKHLAGLAGVNRQ